ncbi:hypothetical protein QZM43_01030 [Burkholderia orbicola]|uniref:hypothetical protein n=1 Tax=Burkholderia cenocepacia TaxID=95486 RepID=UPI002010EC89|nr:MULTISPECIES: hypothetical protein [Burkholderia cepacia complex]MDN7468633.1 hypothetical protein [Burkholderia orbicola]MDN7501292.1 hypothetical protein [Burkholderia orbicola]
MLRARDDGFGAVVNHAARRGRADVRFDDPAPGDDRRQQRVVALRAAARMDDRAVRIDAHDRPFAAAECGPQRLDLLRDAAGEPPVRARFVRFALHFIAGGLPGPQPGVARTQPRTRDAGRQRRFRQRLARGEAGAEPVEVDRP